MNEAEEEVDRAELHDIEYTFAVPIWEGACGWDGLRSELKQNASGGNVCPQCGASGGLILKL